MYTKHKKVYSVIVLKIYFSATYWFLYEKMKKKMTTESLFINSFFSGIVAGGVSSCFTHPFDVVKTKRQVMLGFTNLLFGGMHINFC